MVIKTLLSSTDPFRKQEENQSKSCKIMQNDENHKKSVAKLGQTLKKHAKVNKMVMQMMQTYKIAPEFCEKASSNRPWYGREIRKSWS